MKKVTLVFYSSRIYWMDLVYRIIIIGVRHSGGGGGFAEASRSVITVD